MIRHWVEELAGLGSELIFCFHVLELKKNMPGEL